MQDGGSVIIELCFSRYIFGIQITYFIFNPFLTAAIVAVWILVIIDACDHLKTIEI